MPNKKCCWKFFTQRDERCFKPIGVPRHQLEEIVLFPEEGEALRLSDVEQLYQEEAAKLMNVSRATFARTLISAHKKVAEALLFAKAIRLEPKFIQEKRTKIVIASSGNSLNDFVDQIFAQAKAFILVDEETGEISILENTMQAGYRMGIQAAEQIISSGAKVLISGNVGSRAMQMLQAAGIRIIIQSNMTGAEALKDFQNKKEK